MPAADPAAAPRGFMVQAEWREMLEERIASAVAPGTTAPGIEASAGRVGLSEQPAKASIPESPATSTNWLAHLHLGVLRYQAGDRAGARAAWQASLAQARTPWALRNLAVLAQAEGDLAQAAELCLAALDLRPDLRPLAAECGALLIEAGQPAAWLARVAGLPEAVRRNGRIRLLEARAALAVADLATVERVLAERPVVADLREGEIALSELWFEYHACRLSAAEKLPLDAALRARVRREFPLPAELDFRMRQEP